MWIRPDHPLLARMPSTRPQPSAPGGSSVTRKPPEGQDKPAPPVHEPPLSEEEKQKRAGGFHESSYELKTGMDIFESEWPDDVTIPGPLSDR